MSKEEALNAVEQELKYAWERLDRCSDPDCSVCDRHKKHRKRWEAALKVLRSE